MSSNATPYNEFEYAFNETPPTEFNEITEASRDNALEQRSALIEASRQLLE